MTTPGEASQPQDTRGDGPVELEDRTEPGGQGSPDTNQAKTEPTPEAREAPDLESMNVGAADPQAPSHPALTPAAAGPGGGVGDAAGAGETSEDGLAGSSETLSPATTLTGPQDDPDVPE